MDKMQSYITDFGDLYVEKNNKKVVISKSSFKKDLFFINNFTDNKCETITCSNYTEVLTYISTL